MSQIKILKRIGITSIAAAAILTALNHIPETKLNDNITQFQRQVNITQNRQGQEKRLALVIGNSKYQFAGQLKNPTNDADDMSKTLKELGFEVILVKDASFREMDEAVENFAARLKREKGTGLLFYAGHGIQYQNENYLIPIEAKLNRVQDLKYESVPVGKILGALEDADNKINIVILDACRNNHFTRSWRSTQRGLATVQAVRGTYVAYSAAPGEYAYDGEGENGLFTSQLLQHIKTPNLDIDLMFRRVRSAVVNATNSQSYPEPQTPWSSNSILGEYSLNPTSTQNSVPNIVNSPPPKTKPQVTVNPTPNNPPSGNFSSPRNLVSSATGVDYTPLRNALAANDYRKANQLTSQLMLKAGDKDNNRLLFANEIKSFPCVDLGIIDKLWLDYSNGRFGFSVQRDIYRNSGGTIGEYISNRDWRAYRRYATAVGWRNRTYIPIDRYIFNTTAPKGHLPFVKYTAWHQGDPVCVVGCVAFLLSSCAL